MTAEGFVSTYVTAFFHFSKLGDVVNKLYNFYI